MAMSYPGEGRDDPRFDDEDDAFARTGTKAGTAQDRPFGNSFDQVSR